MMSAFELKTGSEISIANIITTLRRMRDKSGQIQQQICTLRLRRGIKRTGSGELEYSFVELIPPVIPLQKLSSVIGHDGASLESPLWPYATIGNHEPRAIVGRRMILEALKTNSPEVVLNDALRTYIAMQYQGRQFVELSTEELLKLYKAIGPDSQLLQDLKALAAETTVSVCS